jgi:hypothetical protein
MSACCLCWILCVTHGHRFSAQHSTAAPGSTAGRCTPTTLFMRASDTIAVLCPQHAVIMVDLAHSRVAWSHGTIVDLAAWAHSRVAWSHGTSVYLAVPAGWKHQHLHCGCTDKGSSQPDANVPVRTADGAGWQLVATELNCLGDTAHAAQINTTQPGSQERLRACALPTSHQSAIGMHMKASLCSNGACISCLTAVNCLLLPYAGQAYLRC